MIASSHSKVPVQDPMAEIMWAPYPPPTCSTDTFRTNCSRSIRVVTALRPYCRLRSASLVHAVHRPHPRRLNGNHASLLGLVRQGARPQISLAEPHPAFPPPERNLPNQRVAQGCIRVCVWGGGAEAPLPRKGAVGRENTEPFFFRCGLISPNASLPLAPGGPRMTSQ